MRFRKEVYFQLIRYCQTRDDVLVKFTKKMSYNMIREENCYNNFKYWKMLVHC